MKRLISIIALLIVFVAAPVWADWQGTVVWTKSTSPTMAYEKVFYNDVEKCNQAYADPAVCTFLTPTVEGNVTIISYNSQGLPSEPLIINVLAVPNPATGGGVTFIYVQQP